MHGLGNDFIILDARTDGFVPDKRFLLAVSDRHRGIGCDQIIVLHKPKTPSTDIYLDMYNRDGSPQRACGNATRCVARLLAVETGRAEFNIQTEAGFLAAKVDASGMIAIDFGAPRLQWQQIPINVECDTLHIPLSFGVLADPCAVSMGNPHAVFFVDDVARIALSELGPTLEMNAMFPDRCNIEIAQIIAPDRIRMRVWERGAGITQACGTGPARL